MESYLVGRGKGISLFERGPRPDTQKLVVIT